MVPSPPVWRAYLARAAYLWLAVRLFVSCAFLLLGVNPVRLTVAGSVQIMVLCAGLSFLETHRRREWVLLGNLGVRPSILGALFTAPALLGEIVLATTRTWFR